MPSSQSNDRAFLGVERSLSGQRWVSRLNPAQVARAQAIAQDHDNISDVVSRILAARDVMSEDANVYLQPSIRDLLPDPSSLTDMDAACMRLAQAIADGESVAIFGDYDVDGATSSALMYRFLSAFGLQPEIYIPDRIFEGYGPNSDAIRELHGKGHTLLVTVDCGSTSIEALAEADRFSMDILIFDHHQLGIDLPPATAHVNPNRQDDLSGQGHLCAAGVVFLALVGTARELRKRNIAGAPDLMAMLDLVALGTVCDVVPLRGVNRAFVRRGLEIMRQQANAGLTALGRVARLDGPPSPYHLGFLLGPRINAGGRIGDAALGARLLTLVDATEADEIAEQLEALNRERQAIEAQMLEEAMAEAQAEMDGAAPPSLLLTHSDDWHPGIVGLLASRLKDRFRRPSIAIAFDRNGKGSGSCRSLAGVDIGAAVRKAVAQGLLAKGGGHAMAAGLTVQKERLGDLRAFLEAELSGPVTGAIATNELKIDGALTASSIKTALIDEIESVGPFGAGSPQPIFGLPSHRPIYAKVVGQNHVSVTLSSGDGGSVRAIAFRALSTPLGDALLAGDGPLHIAGSASINHYQGRQTPQLRITDAARPDTTI
ncbi:MAG: single-stranded-DNA-specific exonuclease RecJ [Pseudomonadota bacterium]